MIVVTIRLSQRSHLPLCLKAADRSVCCHRESPCVTSSPLKTLEDYLGSRSNMSNPSLGCRVPLSFTHWQTQSYFWNKAHLALVSLKSPHFFLFLCVSLKEDLLWFSCTNRCKAPSSPIHKGYDYISSSPVAGHFFFPQFYVFIS